MRIKKLLFVFLSLLIFTSGIEQSGKALAMEMSQIKCEWEYIGNGSSGEYSEPVFIKEEISPQFFSADRQNDRVEKALVEECLYQGLRNMESVINISECGLSGNEVMEYLSYMGLKYPELFSMTSGVVRWWGPNTEYITKFEPEYSMTKEAYGAALPVYEKAVSQVAEMIDPTWTRTEKVLALYNYFAFNYTYDYTLKANEAYSFFANHIGICRSFTLAMEAVLPQVGVPTSFVRSENLGHAWNIVQLEDGEWYHVDATATWNGAFENAPNYCSYSYFLLSDTQLLHHDKDGVKDWQYDRPEGYPMTTDFSCTSDTYCDYFWRDTSSMASPIVYGTDAWYYLTKDGKLMQWDGSGQPAQLARTIGPYSTFSSLVCRDGALYYSMTHTLECFDLETKTLRQIGEGAETGMGYTGFTIQSLENELLTLNCSVFDFNEKTYSKKTVVIDLCNYIDEREGGYQYCLNTSGFYLRTSGDNPIALAFYCENGKFISVQIYNNQDRYPIQIPDNAEFLKILSIVDTTNWVPVCSAKLIEL